MFPKNDPKISLLFQGIEPGSRGLAINSAPTILSRDGSAICFQVKYRGCDGRGKDQVHFLPSAN